MLTTVETAPFVKLVKTQHVRSAKPAKLAKLLVAKVQHVKSANLPVAKGSAEIIVIVIVIVEGNL